MISFCDTLGDIPLETTEPKNNVISLQGKSVTAGLHSSIQGKPYFIEDLNPGEIIPDVDSKEIPKSELDKHLKATICVVFKLNDKTRLCNWGDARTHAIVAREPFPLNVEEFIKQFGSNCLPSTVKLFELYDEEFILAVSTFEQINGLRKHSSNYVGICTYNSMPHEHNKKIPNGVPVAQLLGDLNAINVERGSVFLRKWYSCKKAKQIDLEGIEPDEYDIHIGCICRILAEFLLRPAREFEESYTLHTYADRAEEYASDVRQSIKKLDEFNGITGEGPILKMSPKSLMNYAAYNIIPSTQHY